MKRILRIILAASILLLPEFQVAAKSYSSGSRSYSSSRSSGGSKSFGSGHSGSRSSFGSGSKSSSGKSYSSGGNSKSSYTSGKSYSSGSERSFTSRPSNKSSDSTSATARKSSPPASSPGMKFDTEAARASKVESSKRTFTSFKDAGRSKVSDSANSGRVLDSDHTGGVPPVIPRATTPGYSPPPASGSRYARTYSETHYYPEPQVYSTRRIRINHYYAPYYSRPVVVFHDNYSSLFWWWLLDQSLEDRALWAYHHRADMDAARYQALVANDARLENRVQQLEQEQVSRDTNFTPATLDRDLMFTDQSVTRAYSNRPTTAGIAAFWIILVPGMLLMGLFFVWLVFFKRWQVRTT